MIKLDVKEYCHSCPGFKAVVSKSGTSTQVNEYEKAHTDTIIRCKYRGRCENIKHYLEREKRKGELN